MDTVPHDSVCVILSFLSLEQQLQASACCKKWRSVVTPPPYGILHAPQTLLAVSYDFDKLKPFYQFQFYQDYRPLFAYIQQQAPHLYHSTKLYLVENQQQPIIITTSTNNNDTNAATIIPTLPSTITTPPTILVDAPPPAYTHVVACTWPALFDMLLAQLQETPMSFNSMMNMFRVKRTTAISKSMIEIFFETYSSFVTPRQFLSYLLDQFPSILQQCSSNNNTLWHKSKLQAWCTLLELWMRYHVLEYFAYPLHPLAVPYLQQQQQQQHGKQQQQQQHKQTEQTEHAQQDKILLQCMGQWLYFVDEVLLGHVNHEAYQTATTTTTTLITIPVQSHRIALYLHGIRMKYEIHNLIRQIQTHTTVLSHVELLLPSKCQLVKQEAEETNAIALKEAILSKQQEQQVLAPPKYVAGQCTLITTCTPIEMAHHLTRIERDLYVRFKTYEFCGKPWRSKQMYKCPNLACMLDNFDKIAMWVSAEIVLPKTVEQRGSKLTYFLHVCTCLLEMNNFQTLFAIVAGLLSASVFRMNETWAQLTAEQAKQVELFRELVSLRNDFATYRTYLASCSNVPCLPYFGMFMGDLKLMHDYPIHPQYAALSHALLQQSNNTIILYPWIMLLHEYDCIYQVRCWQRNNNNNTAITTTTSFEQACHELYWQWYEAPLDINTLYATSLLREPRQ